MPKLSRYEEKCWIYICAILKLMQDELARRGWPKAKIMAFIQEKEIALKGEMKHLWFLPEAQKTYDELRSRIGVTNGREENTMVDKVLKEFDLMPYNDVVRLFLRETDFKPVKTLDNRTASAFVAALKECCRAIIRLRMIFLSGGCLCIRQASRKMKTAEIHGQLHLLTGMTGISV